VSAIVAFLGVRGTVVAGIALVLALAAGVQTARLWKLQAESAEAAAQLTIARGANKAWQEAADAAEAEREKAEAARKRQAEQAAEAIAAAEVAKAKAERELANFTQRWNGRPPSCAIALGQMELACAASLSDY
jgi:hypothetical protein